MISLTAYRDQWFSTIRTDLRSGLVVAPARIPEAIFVSIIAGGRPGMISAAVLRVTLLRDHGWQYRLAATVLTGLQQIGMGLGGWVSSSALWRNRG